MKYAVIKISGTQIQVSEDQVLTIDNLNQKVEEKGSLTDIILTVNDDQVNIGHPLVEKASVDYEVVKNFQGTKIKVFKYKAKSRYRKTQGFRPQLTDIKITKINI